MLSEITGNRLDEYAIFALGTTEVNCNSERIADISVIRAENGNIMGEFLELVNSECAIPYYESKWNYK